MTAQNLLRGASDDPTETTRKLEGDVAAREIPRAPGDTFLVKAEARVGRNDTEEPRSISVAPVDERSERRRPSFNSRRPFNSLPSPTSFQTLSHAPS